MKLKLLDLFHFHRIPVSNLYPKLRQDSSHYWFVLRDKWPNSISQIPTYREFLNWCAKYIKEKKT